MQVRCQGSHDGHLALQCTNYWRHIFGRYIVNVKKGWEVGVFMGSEVAEHPLVGPGGEMRLDELACSPGLEA